MGLAAGADGFVDHSWTWRTERNGVRQMSIDRSEKIVRREFEGKRPGVSLRLCTPNSTAAELSLVAKFVVKCGSGCVIRKTSPEPRVLNSLVRLQFVNPPDLGSVSPRCSVAIAGAIHLRKEQRFGYLLNVDIPS
jgi:hypothetical protein